MEQTTVIVQSYFRDDADVIGVLSLQTYMQNAVFLQTYRNFATLAYRVRKPGWGSTGSKSQSRNNCGSSAQNLRANPTLQAKPISGLSQLLPEFLVTRVHNITVIRN
jgi:hypothetical protein